MSNKNSIKRNEIIKSSNGFKESVQATTTTAKRPRIISPDND